MRSIAQPTKKLICEFWREAAERRTVHRKQEHAATERHEKEARLGYAVVELTGQAQQLIDRERQDPEHQMRHDLGGAAYPECAAAELVF
jgi:hypothetical protein